MKTKTENKHGGKRQGAGRKKKPPTKLKTFRIPAEHYTELTQQINQLINTYKT